MFFTYISFGTPEEFFKFFNALFSVQFILFVGAAIALLDYLIKNFHPEGKNSNYRKYVVVGGVFLFLATSYVRFLYSHNNKDIVESSFFKSSIKVLEYESTLENEKALENILLSMSPLDEKQFIQEVRKSDSLKLATFLNKRLAGSGKKMDQGQKQKLISEVLASRKLEALKGENGLSAKMMASLSNIINRFLEKKDIDGVERLNKNWGITENTQLYTFNPSKGINYKERISFDTYLMETVYGIGQKPSRISIVSLDYKYSKITGIYLQK